MEIQEISFGRFRAAEHVQFGAEICELIDVSPVKEQLPQFGAYKGLRDEELKIFKKETASVLTPELTDADRMRDKLVKLMNERIDYYKRTIAGRQTASENKKAKK